MHTAIFLISNIHCPSCVSYIQDTLHNVVGVTAPAEVSLIEHTVRVLYEETLTDGNTIAGVLLNAAFEVEHVTEFNQRHIQSHSYKIDTSSSTPKRSPWHGLRSRTRQKHIDNCLACQREKARKPSKWKSWSESNPLSRTLSQIHVKSPSEPPNTGAAETAVISDKPTVINMDGAHDHSPRREFAVTLSIGGMTCSACTSTISNELYKLDCVLSVDVNLVSSSAKVVFQEPRENSSRIAEAVEDIGYEATVADVREQSCALPELYRAQLSIKGMTCGSCVGIITRGLQELPQVTSVNIDLISNSGIVEFRGKDTLKGVEEKFDDLGYDADVVKNTILEVTAASSAERTVQIKVDGMYCPHCPDKVLETLDKFRDSKTEKASFQVTQDLTLEDPIVIITYRPSVENNITIRHFVRSINAADEALTASVYRPPSLEERSRHLQRKERNLILLRLLFTAVVAIPTFIIGVVYMSLVPSRNHTRQWLEQPMWSGLGMRIDWALFIMTTPVMGFGADLFHRRAIKEIWAMWRPKSKVPLLRRFYRFGSMNLLISAGTMVAYFSSLAILILDATAQDSQNHSGKRSSDTYFDTVVFLTFFLLIGRYLEAYSKAKTGDAVAMLSNLRPTEAKLVENGTVQSVPVDQLEVGDAVQIPRGQSPPTDGHVDQEGSFLFDESSLTGESRPVKKVHDDRVFTGSVNVSNAVRIRITDLGGSSMLDQIIEVVREGQAKRAPIERLADILTGYFVPVITLIAITTWLIWLGLGVGGALPSAWLDVRRGGWPFWSLEFAIAVFVVACPCGIGLAAPTALFVGGGLAAKNSILVQGGGEAFQEASRLSNIVFDKTGTLTQGQMKVIELEVLSPDWNDSIVKAAAKILEDASSHPIAKAISEFCSHSPTNLEYNDIQERSGMGMVGTFNVNGTQYSTALGNRQLLSHLNNTSDSDKSESRTTEEDYFLEKSLREHQSQGHSIAIFAVKDLSVNDSPDNPLDNTHFKPIAIFAISDPIRPEAPSVLSSLRASGLDVHMCTGDNSTTARAIATQLGIPVTNVRAGVLPQDKAAYINQLQHPSSLEAPIAAKPSRKIVAFVGDGTNDTPALSAADVSIALSSGSDIAMTTAAFILLKPDLNTILTLVSLSKRVFTRVKLNFAWAGIYNICLVPVAAGIFFAVGANNEHGGWRLNPVWASCAMAASSVSVVLSSLALRLPEMKIKLGMPNMKVHTPWRRAS